MPGLWSCLCPESSATSLVLLCPMRLQLSCRYCRRQEYPGPWTAGQVKRLRTVDDCPRNPPASAVGSCQIQPQYFDVLGTVVVGIACIPTVGTGQPFALARPNMQAAMTHLRGIGRW